MLGGKTMQVGKLFCLKKYGDPIEQKTFSYMIVLFVFPEWDKMAHIYPIHKQPICGKGDWWEDNCRNSQLYINAL